MSNPPPSLHLVDAELLAGAERPPLVMTREALPQLRVAIGEMLQIAADNAAPVATPIVCDVVFVPGADGAPDVRVQTYRPLTVAGVMPAYLHMHGGGYVFGTSPYVDVQCKALAAALNCFVASVDYRVAPETVFPDAIEDCYAALRWLHGAAETLGVDAKRIAIGGESAGGGLTAALALLARDRGEFPICYQVLTYPMIDDRTGLAPNANPWVGQIGWTPQQNEFGWSALLGGPPGGADVSPYAAAARATDLSGLPPALIMVGSLDLFLEENVDYAARLLRAGVPAELHVYPGAYHGFETFLPAASLSQAAKRDRISALKRAFAKST